MTFRTRKKSLYSVCKNESKKEGRGKKEKER